jgi:uncharacterized protein YeaO (DUF488 family)
LETLWVYQESRSARRLNGYPIAGWRSILDIKTKRVYDAASKDDGFRVLVDRLWPRGMTKGRVAADAWMKELAPSTELRKWFKHEAPKWTEFKRRYFQELDQNLGALDELRQAIGKGKVTLLYSAQDTERNHAAALKEFLTG